MEVVLAAVAGAVAGAALAWVIGRPNRKHAQTGTQRLQCDVCHTTFTDGHEARDHALTSHRAIDAGTWTDIISEV